MQDTMQLAYRLELVIIHRKERKVLKIVDDSFNSFF